MRAIRRAAFRAIWVLDYPFCQCGLCLFVFFPSLGAFWCRLDESEWSEWNDSE